MSLWERVCHVNEVFCDDRGCGCADCHTDAAICDKCRSGKGYCHVNGVFCDDRVMNRYSRRRTSFDGCELFRSETEK